MGIASFVLSLVSFAYFGPILGVPAIILGALGRKATREGRCTSSGLATAGLVLGIISTVLYTTIWVALLAWMRWYWAN
jgi:hypothetical protein